MITMCEVAGYVVTVSGNDEEDCFRQAVRIAKLSYGILALLADVKLLAIFNLETKSWM